MRATGIHGWMDLRELEWLAARAAVSDVVVEIGAARGRSTRALGDAARGTVYTIDPWDNPVFGRFRGFLSNLGDLVTAGKVIPLRHRSQDVAHRLADFLGGTADLVFIDGDHSYEAVRRDILFYRPMLRRGGVLSGHDYDSNPRHEGVRRAVDELVGPAGHVGLIWWVVV